MNRQVLVGLGANLGDTAGHLREALDALAALGEGELRCSSMWRSAPVDCPPGSPDFLNAVAWIDVDLALAPEALLAALLDIEQRGGRQRSAQRHAPRTLDLDLLLVGEMRQQTAQLTLPHPRAHLRAFVLAPAAELVPDLIWPGLGLSVVELLAGLPQALRDEVQRVETVSRPGADGGVTDR